jgi:AcrR family transcriptional regulator
MKKQEDSRMPNPQTGRDDTEARILAAAAGLFARSGFAGVSTRDIAAAAGVNEVTIFRHFPHKRDLYLATLESAFRQVKLSRELLAKVAEAQDAKSVLTQTFALISAGLTQTPDLLRLVQFSALELDSAVKLILRRHLGEYVEVVARYLQPWIDNGQLRSSSANALALAVVSIVISHHSLHAVFSSDVPLADVMFEAYVNLSVN